jgi:hypothetical protein
MRGCCCAACARCPYACGSITRTGCGRGVPARSRTCAPGLPSGLRTAPHRSTTLDRLYAGLFSFELDTDEFDDVRRFVDAPAPVPHRRELGRRRKPRHHAVPRHAGGAARSALPPGLVRVSIGPRGRGRAHRRSRGTALDSRCPDRPRPARSTADDSRSIEALLPLLLLRLPLLIAALPAVDGRPVRRAARRDPARGATAAGLVAARHGAGWADIQVRRRRAHRGRAAGAADPARHRHADRHLGAVRHDPVPRLLGRAARAAGAAAAHGIPRDGDHVAVHRHVMGLRRHDRRRAHGHGRGARRAARRNRRRRRVGCILRRQDVAALRFDEHRAIGANAPLYSHIRHMLYTALPSFVLAPWSTRSRPRTAPVGRTACPRARGCCSLSSTPSSTCTGSCCCRR